MLGMNTTRNTRAAPQQYEEALAALGFIAKVAKNISERGRSAAEIDRGRGHAMPTLLEEWEHQTSASGSLQPQGSLLDQFHSVTPGAIAMRRLRHLREVVGWIRKL
jgi:hypothetical protein